MLISEAFDLYRDSYMIFKNQSKRIIETHERVKRTMIYSLGNIKVEKLTPDTMRPWLNDISKGRSQNTVRNDLIRVRNVLEYLQLRDIKCMKPQLLPVPKRIDTIPTYATPEEVDLMIEHAHCLRNRFIISLFYSSGIRLSELIQLDRGQIQSKRFTVVGKNGKARLCFIDDRTSIFMKSYLRTRHDNCRALFISHLYKERMTPTNVQLVVTNAAKRAGIDKHITPHSLRHGFATNFLQNNGNMRYCQELLGHASIETTMAYAHVTNRDLEEQYKKFHTT